MLLVPTDEGLCYFKASAPALVYEAGLTEALVEWFPQWMPELLACDTERGWLLMRDSGIPLRKYVRSVGDLTHWGKVLPAYAELQIALSDRVNELLSFGVLDRRLASLPDKFETLLNDRKAMCFGSLEGLTEENYRKLLGLHPRFARMCETLVGYGIPESLHHDDFHDANIFLRDGRYTLTDWGEACLAHPFFSMLVNLRSTAYSMKWEYNDSRLNTLRDAYLKPWECFASHTDLLAAYRLAVRIAMVNRALTWHHVVSSLDEAQRVEYEESVPGWLLEFLEAELSDPISI